MTAELNETLTFVTQSRYFSPAFNTAIFDGPIRIYFSQHQEAMALKFHFKLQNRYRHMQQPEKAGYSWRRGKNVFIMLYPSHETFALSFLAGGDASKACAGTVVAENLGDDHIIGVCGAVDEEVIQKIYVQVDKILGHKMDV